MAGGYFIGQCSLEHYFILTWQLNSFLCSLGLDVSEVFGEIVREIHILTAETPV